MVKTIEELYDVFNAIKVPKLKMGKNSKAISKKCKDFVKNKIRVGRPKKAKYVADTKKPWEDLITEALQGPDNTRWTDILCQSTEDLQTKIQRLSDKEKKTFWKMHELALETWKCEHCGDYRYEDMKSNYIECTGMVFFSFVYLSIFLENNVFLPLL